MGMQWGLSELGWFIEGGSESNLNAVDLFQGGLCLECGYKGEGRTS
jgi:hypothetical protein